MSYQNDYDSTYDSSYDFTVYDIGFIFNEDDDYIEETSDPYDA